jgi:hypothetical protein
LPTIHGSCIDKCVHGIYLESAEAIRSDKARYCGFCTPSLDTEKTAEQWEALVAANPVLQHRYDSTSCPACRCETHHIDGKMWVCTDCRNEWKPPRGSKNSKAFVSIRRVEQ